MGTEEANWSESTLFAKAGHIQVQQTSVIFFHHLPDKGRKVVDEIFCLSQGQPIMVMSSMVI